MAQIILEWDEQGNCNLDISAMQGKGCAEVAAKFDALGRVVEDTKKDEYYRSGGAASSCGNLASNSGGR